MDEKGLKKSKSAGQSGKTRKRQSGDTKVSKSGKKQKQELGMGDPFFKDIVATVREPLLVLTSDLCVLFANQSFYDLFRVTPRQTINKLVYDLGSRQWDIPALHKLLEEILPRHTQFNDFQVEHEFPRIGKRTMLLNARQIVEPKENRQLILLAIEDVTDCIKIKQDLQDSEERFRQAFETARDGMLLIEKTSGRIVMSNQAAQELLGYSEEEFLKNKLWKFGFIKDRGEYEKAAAQLEAGGLIDFSDALVVTGDGREIPADVYIMNKARVFQCNIRDIRERKLESDKIMEYEARYHELFNHMSSGVAVYAAVDDGHDFIFRDFNAAAEKIDKTPREHVIGRRVTEVFPGIREMGLLDVFRRVWKSGKPEHHPASVYKDKRLVGWRENYVYKLSSGEIVAVYDDITERKKIEEELADVQTWMNAILNNAPITIFAIDNQGKFTLSKGKPLSRAGLLQDENVGISSLDLYGSMCFTEYSGKVITGQEVYQRALMGETIEAYNRLNGVDFDNHIGPIIDKDGKVLGVVGVATDITERKKADEEVRKRADELNALQETIYNITSPKPLPELLQLIVQKAAALLNAPSGGLYLADPQKRQVRCVVSYNTAQDFTGTVIAYGEGAAGYVAETGKALIIDDYRYWQGRAEVFEKIAPFQAIISAPLIWQGKVTGVLHLLRDNSTNKFSHEDLQLLMVFANHAAVAVENSRLMEAALSELAERENAEKSLQLSEVRFRGLFENSPISLWEEDFSAVKKRLDALRTQGVTDLAAYLEAHPQEIAKCAALIRTIDTNQASLALYRAANKEELLIRHKSVFGSPQLLHGFRGELIRIFEGQTNFSYIGENLTLDGDYIDITLSWSAVPGHEEDLSRVIISIGDITELVRAKEALDQEAVRRRILIEESRDGIVVLDENGKVVEANQRFAEMLGYSREETASLHVWDWDVMLPREKVKEMIRTVDESGDNFETQHKRKDGSVFDVEISTNGSIVAGQKLIFCVCRDITERKQAEEKLRESEERFRNLYENATVGIYRTTPGGKILLANPALLKMLGFSSFEELVERDLNNEGFEPTYSRHKYIKDLEEAGEIRGLESVWKRKDGSIIYVRESARVTRDETGKVLYYEGTVEDITERKQAELLIAESEAKFKWLYINAPIPYHIISADGIIMDVNQRWCEVLGYTKEEALGREIFDFIVEKETAKISFENKKASKKTYFEGSECNYRTKNGEIRTFRTYDFLTLDQNKNIASIQTTIEDITARKRAEQEIMANVERLRALTEILQHKSESIQEFLDYALQQALFLTKSELGYIYFYDEESQEFTLNSWSNDVMKECSIQDAQLVYQLKTTGIWGEAVRQRKPIVLNDFHAPHPLKKGYPEGHAHLSKFMTIPVINDAKIVAVVGVANKPDDYTDTDVLQLTLLMGSVWKVVEQRLTQAQLEEYSQNLEAMVTERTRDLTEAQEKLLRQERLATMGQLAGSVGHELRNPLNVINSSVYLLMKTLTGLDKKSRHYLDIINQETQKSAKIISDLLDFGRKSETNKEKVSTKSLVSQALARSQPPENIKVIPSEISETLTVMVDAQQIGQALDNLISNAFQAMPNGGKLTVKAARQKSEITISVADTGTGISKENLGKLFEPLFTTKARGIGLGLALSKNYIEANGGSIAVESEEGKGSTFTISFKDED